MRFRMGRRSIFPYHISSGTRWRWIKRVVFFLVLLILSFFLVDTRIRPVLFQIAQAKARQMATRAINEAIQRKISKNLHYEDLIAIKVDNRGRVVLMQPNTGEINRLASQATIEVQERLRKVTKEKVNIPLGQVLQSHVLGGLGPMIPVTIMPIGTVESRVYDTFEQAGINQTRHKIYLEVKATVKIVVPLSGSRVLVRTEMPLTEAIIMGEVPQVYFSGNNPSVSIPPGSVQLKP